MTGKTEKVHLQLIVVTGETTYVLKWTLKFQHLQYVSKDTLDKKIFKSVKISEKS